MINRIDRYVITQFIVYFFIFLLGIFVLYIVVDFFEKLDKFIKAELSPFKIVVYYFYQLPELYVLLLPPALLLTPLFAIGGLARNREILAMKSAGIYVFRIFAPLIILGIIWTASSFIVQEFVQPYAHKKIQEMTYREIKKIPPPVERVNAKDLSFFEKGGRYFYTFGDISSRTGIGRNIIILELEEGKPIRRIDADEGEFNGNSWTLFNGIERTFDKKSNLVQSNTFSKRTFAEFTISPIDILKEKKTLNEMNLFEIFHLIDKLKDSGLGFFREMVEAQSRMAFPLVNLLTLFFALPFSVTLERSGRTFAFAVASFITFVYWGLMEITKSMGQVGTLSPYIAPWIPNILFFITGIIFAIKVKK